jgi:hypothetical protein
LQFALRRDSSMAGRGWTGPSDQIGEARISNRPAPVIGPNEIVAMKPTFAAWDKLSRMHSLVTLSFVLVGVVALVTAIFAFLNFSTARTYRPTVDQVVSILDAVIARRVTYQAWDEFICVPIRYNADLEQVRLRCVALEADSYLDKSRSEWRGDAGFNAAGLAKIEEIRDSLVLRDAQSAAEAES